MTTNYQRRLLAYALPIAIVAVVAIAVGVLTETGFALGAIPIIAGAAVIWAVLAAGGFKVGAALADWLERRWH